MIRRVGMEWELVMPREAAVRVIEAHTGEHARVVRRCRVNPDGTRFMEWKIGGWVVGGDPSLIKDGIPIPDCTEVATPPMTDDTWTDALRALAAAGARLTPRCGLHVHVDAATLTAGQLARVCALEHHRRHAGLSPYPHPPPIRVRYARDVPEVVRQLDATATVEDLARAWYGDKPPDFVRVPHRHPSRRRMVNVHSWWYRGTLEFRGPTMTLDVERVATIAAWCRALVDEVTS